MRTIVIMVAVTALSVVGCSDDGPCPDRKSACSGAISCERGTFEGHISVRTTGDLSGLAGYTSISGDLIFVCPTCKDLCELRCLESIGGRLVIGGQESDETEHCMENTITDLDGLRSLSTVGTDLWVYCNSSLRNVDGLQNITSVGQGIQVLDNPKLSKLNGLCRVTSVSSWGLMIWGNDSLDNLDGLDNIESVEGPLIVRENTRLPDCETCEFLGQLDTDPHHTSVYGNLDDSCTPVPENCP